MPDNEDDEVDLPNVDNYLADGVIEDARITVENAITNALTDDVRGAVRLGADELNEFDVECTSFDELSDHLADRFVDFVRKEVSQYEVLVRDFDAADEVATILSKTKFENFFFQIREPKDAQRIISSQQLVASAAQSKLIQKRFDSVSGELIEYFAKHPEKLREIDPDDFEKLMAGVFRNQGFDVTKTPKSKDGGVDLMLVRHSAVGAAMTLVDCKRYAANNKVGVEIVRGMYGIVEERKATSGMIVTTSFFTKGAVDFRNQLEYRLALADFNRVKDFLAQWNR